MQAEPDYNSRTAPTEPDSYRKYLHSFVISDTFEIFISIVIILNMISLAMTYEGADSKYILALEIINYIFTSIFTLEIIIKFLSFHCSF